MELKIITFWCHRCRKDWKSIAERVWINSLFGEMWGAKCEDCGARMVRLINDATNDPYYRLSRRCQELRMKHADDMVQMNDPRFDVLYPWHKREREAKLEAEERNNWELKRLK